MNPSMAILFFLLAVTGAGFGGYALLVWLGLDDLEAWAGGRIAGLVLVALPAWWAGVVGFSEWRSVGAAFLVAVALVGGWVIWKRKEWRSVLIAEAIFLGIAAVIIFIRLDHPQISFTEKPMDLGILASLLRADGFPPPDMWLAGEALPYYYWGALLWTVPLWVSHLPLEFGYNLIVGIIGGMVGSLLWMLGRRAGGSHLSGLLVTFFGLLAGTPDGMRRFSRHISGISIPICSRCLWPAWLCWWRGRRGRRGPAGPTWLSWPFSSGLSGPPTHGPCRRLWLESRS
jgi:hypothetical protein